MDESDDTSQMSSTPVATAIHTGKDRNSTEIQNEVSRTTVVTVSAASRNSREQREYQREQMQVTSVQRSTSEIKRKSKATVSDETWVTPDTVQDVKEKESFGEPEVTFGQVEVHISPEPTSSITGVVNEGYEAGSGEDITERREGNCGEHPEGLLTLDTARDDPESWEDGRLDYSDSDWDSDSETWSNLYDGSDASYTVEDGPDGEILLLDPAGIVVARRSSKSSTLSDHRKDMAHRRRHSRQHSGNVNLQVQMHRRRKSRQLELEDNQKSELSSKDKESRRKNRSKKRKKRGKQKTEDWVSGLASTMQLSVATTMTDRDDKAKVIQRLGSVDSGGSSKQTPASLGVEGEVTTNRVSVIAEVSESDVRGIDEENTVLAQPDVPPPPPLAAEVLPTGVILPPTPLSSNITDGGMSGSAIPTPPPLPPPGITFGVSASNKTGQAETSGSVPPGSIPPPPPLPSASDLRNAVRQETPETPEAREQDKHKANHKLLGGTLDFSSELENRIKRRSKQMEELAEHQPRPEQGAPDIRAESDSELKRSNTGSRVKEGRLEDVPFIPPRVLNNHNVRRSSTRLQTQESNTMIHRQGSGASVSRVERRDSSHSKRQEVSASDMTIVTRRGSSSAKRQDSISAGRRSVARRPSSLARKQVNASPSNPVASFAEKRPSARIEREESHSQIDMNPEVYLNERSGVGHVEYSSIDRHNSMNVATSPKRVSHETMKHSASFSSHNAGVVQRSGSSARGQQASSTTRKMAPQRPPPPRTSSSRRTSSRSTDRPTVSRRESNSKSRRSSDKDSGFSTDSTYTPELRPGAEARRTAGPTHQTPWSVPTFEPPVIPPISPGRYSVPPVRTRQSPPEQDSDAFSSILADMTLGKVMTNPFLKDMLRESLEMNTFDQNDTRSTSWESYPQQRAPQYFDPPSNASPSPMSPTNPFVSPVGGLPADGSPTRSKQGVRAQRSTPKMGKRAVRAVAHAVGVTSYLEGATGRRDSTDSTQFSVTSDTLERAVPESPAWGYPVEDLPDPFSTSLEIHHTEPHYV